VVKLSRSSLPVGVRERRCSATTGAVYPQCTETETVPHLHRCQARGPWRFQFFTHLLVHLKDTHTVDTLRYTIVDGIQGWFITGAANDRDNTGPVVQMGWFQVLRGCIPNYYYNYSRPPLES
jgi:hypothetical protein